MKMNDNEGQQLTERKAKENVGVLEQQIKECEKKWWNVEHRDNKRTFIANVEREIGT